MFHPVWQVSLKARFNFGPQDQAKLMGLIGLTYALSQGVVAKALIARAGPDPSRLLLVCVVLLRRWLKKWNETLQILRVSFSAVWTATIATKYSFCSIFRDLQDSHTFAPLRSKKFSKKSSKFLAEWSESFISFHSRFSIEFAIFRRNFDEILPEFHRNDQEKTKCLEILKKMREKFGKWPQNARNFRNLCEISFVHFIFSIISLENARIQRNWARGDR